MSSTVKSDAQPRKKLAKIRGNRRAFRAENSFMYDFYMEKLGIWRRDRRAGAIGSAPKIHIDVDGLIAVSFVMIPKEALS